MSPDEIVAGLRTVLGVTDVTDLRRLTGGASRETWSFLADGERLVLQRERAGSTVAGAMATEAALVRAAADAGVPVARVVAADVGDTPLGSGFLIAEFIEGETIARKIQRDDEFVAARATLATQCGTALAAIHQIDPTAVPGLAPMDQVRYYREVLDGYGDAIPTFEVAFQWLAANRPASAGQSIVHGDFRLGNLMVGADGLRAVVDWELAHIGDPMEDLGWLCVRAWRFGGDAPVAGIGTYDDLFAAYASASGTPVDRETVRWWEVLGTLKWGIMCIVQARAHLDGLSRSMELAAIGRRICENEYDLFGLLAPDVMAEARAASTPEPVVAPSWHGRPTAAELVEAVAEWVVSDVRESTEGRVAFHTRVAANVLATVQRELELGPDMDAAYAERMRTLGYADEAELSTALRTGTVASDDAAMLAVVAATVLDKVRVANPKYL